MVNPQKRHLSIMYKEEIEGTTIKINNKKGKIVQTDSNIWFS